MHCDVRTPTVRPRLRMRMRNRCPARPGVHRVPRHPPHMRVWVWHADQPADDRDPQAQEAGPDVQADRRPAGMYPLRGEGSTAATAALREGTRGASGNVGDAAVPSVWPRVPHLRSCWRRTETRLLRWGRLSVARCHMVLGRWWPREVGRTRGSPEYPVACEHGRDIRQDHQSVSCDASTTETGAPTGPSHPVPAWRAAFHPITRGAARHRGPRDSRVGGRTGERCPSRANPIRTVAR